MSKTGYSKENTVAYAKMTNVLLPQIGDKKELALFLEITDNELKSLLKKQDNEPFQELLAFLSQENELIEKNKLKMLIEPLNQGAVGYDYFFVKKSNGKGYRLIANPKPLTRKVQKIINRKILSKLPISNIALAYIPKEKRPAGWTWQKGVFEAAGNKAVFGEADIKSYFHSITEYIVHRMFRRHTTYVTQVCKALARCCTDMGVVPQGSITGPAISNIIMYKSDYRIAKALAKRGWTVGRYSDNYVFGCNPNEVWENCENDTEMNKLMHFPFKVIKNELSKRDFALNADKCWVGFNSEGRKIMNLGVSSKLNIPVTTYKRLKSGVHNFVVKKQAPSKYEGNLSTYYQSLRGKVTYWAKIAPKVQKLTDVLLTVNPKRLNEDEFTFVEEWN